MSVSVGNPIGDLTWDSQSPLLDQQVALQSNVISAARITAMIYMKGGGMIGRKEQRKGGEHGESDFEL